ncbi:MAG: Sir2 family NAD-dependent protein deacetylase [Candidatus Omnitrophica bacterium]|nr:Sir2 family NAD-dependent protein deacetylase [Candidatus Omnitrophota bacterium]
MLSSEVKEFIKKSLIKGEVVCLTGAGVSLESGIPVFRGKGGLWERYDPQIYGYPEGLTALFKTTPKRVIDFIVDFYNSILNSKPNPVHRILSLLERQGILKSIITQNIDNLHQESGSRNVIELHGNAYRIRCSECFNKFTLEKERLKEFIRLLKKYRSQRIKLLKILARYFPRCSCGGRFRIDIVLFGENLSESTLLEAYRQLDNCKTLIVLGTSLAVYPAANLPFYAKERGAKIIVINPEITNFSDYCDYQIRAEAGKAMLEIFKCLTIQDHA